MFLQAVIHAVTQAGRPGRQAERQATVYNGGGRFQVRRQGVQAGGGRRPR